ncbi:MAG: DUF3857 domain-containing protein [Pseudomonadota bacterium]
MTMPRHISSLAALALLLCHPAPAAASTDARDDAVVVERDEQAFTVQADGSYQVRIERNYRIVQARAIDKASQESIEFDGKTETVELLAAYTEKPDGRRIAVSPEQVRFQQRTLDASTFQDRRVMIVVYPKVAVGDLLSSTYVLRRLTPPLPGHFEDYTASGAYHRPSLHVSYDLPENMPLYFDAIGFRGTRSPGAPGRTIHRWELSGDGAVLTESDAISWYETHERLLVSTTRDGAALGAAYDALARPRSAPTAKSRALADQLCAKTGAQRACALALADWVRTHIRTVTTTLGPAGVAPRAADEVLATGVGDAKDHVALLESLLGARAIDSTPALISSYYVLPGVASLNVFDYVITFIPGLDLYVDSSATNIAAGYLPAVQLGRPVLLTHAGRMARTPAAQVQTRTTETEWKLGPDGGAEFGETVTAGGMYAELIRSEVRNTRTPDLERAGERLLNVIGYKGGGALDPGNLEAGGSYVYKYAGKVEQLAALPGPSGMPTLTTLNAGIRAKWNTLTAEKERTLSFLCQAEDFDEQARFILPEGVRVFAMPKPLELHDPFIDYSASYTQDGTTVLVKRSLHVHPGDILCSAQDHQRMRPLLARIGRDLSSQIIVRSAP